VPSEGLDSPVIFISSSPEFGGAEALLLSILDGLDSDVVETVVFIGDGPVVQEVRDRGMPTLVLPASRRGGLLWSAVRLRRALKQRRGKVVHANGMRAAIVTSMAAIGTGQRVVWLKVDSSRDGTVARAVGRRSARIVGISHSVNETFRGGTRKKLRVVYPGVARVRVNRASARTLVRELIGLPEETEVVVIAARLCPDKGQRDLIDAVPGILSHRPSVHFALLGGELWPWEGFEAALRTRAEELNVGSSITFLGHRPRGIESHTDVIRFMAGCDVLAAPSRHNPKSGWAEGFGYAPVEAMSVGVPVVAYRHGSFPEVLGDDALLVPEGDVEQLGTAIVRLLDDRKLATQLRDRGPIRAGRFRPENTIAGLREVYRDLSG
jgi:glycosyltransferase involved in cell wall biosynthesis